MPAIRGVTISVGYASELSITLVRNMRHLTECLVITSPEDEETKAVAEKVPGAKVFVTDAFTRPDARGVRPRFNKGHAMTLGIESFGRHGLCLIWDADILLPDSLPFEQIRPGHLHGARRRVLEDISKWRADLDWRMCPAHTDGGCIGFFQLFDMNDDAIKNKHPIYDVSFGHAGGADAEFMTNWPTSKHVRLNLEVLHLGRTDVNWFGKGDADRDRMAKFVTLNQWSRAMKKHDPSAVERAGELVERVEVPGFPKSDYELPFVRRAQNRRQGRA